MVVLSEAGHEMSAGEAFSAGLGLAIGLLMGQHLLGTIELPEEVVTKRVIICQKCAAKNPVDNKFCNNCGQSLYPPPKIKCQNCPSEMPVTMKFCGNCGASLKR
jgi:rRNA maturation endonuclease Nob1